MTLGNGNMIRRYPGESIIEAAKRAAYVPPPPAVVSHLVEIMSGDPGEDELSTEIDLWEPPSASEWEADIPEDCPEETDDDLLAAAVVDSWGRNQMSYVFPAERVEKHTLTKRKEVMDGVYMPTRSKTGASKHVTFNKENGSNERATAPATRSVSRGPGPMTTEKRSRTQTTTPNAPAHVPKPTEKSTPQAPAQAPPKSRSKTPVPADARRPEFDGRNDDHILDDGQRRKPLISRQPVQSRSQAPIVGNNDRTKDAYERRPVAARQSEITSYTRPLNIMNQILNTRIDLCVGEVLGISKEISGMIGDKMKPKVQRLTNPEVTGLPVATSFMVKDRGMLIKLHMQCDGPPFKAIIDTGSMVNIVSQTVCNENLNRQVDYSQTMQIADANGGSGVLRGLLTNVPLFCGSVCTPADLYVKEGAPFEMLLGRPWQRENLITIDERPTGTYIIFKDADEELEIKVTEDRPEKHDDVDQEWNTYLITAGAGSSIAEITDEECLSEVSSIIRPDLATIAASSNSSYRHPDNYNVPLVNETEDEVRQHQDDILTPDNMVMVESWLKDMSADQFLAVQHALNTKEYRPEYSPSPISPTHNTMSRGSLLHPTIPAFTPLALDPVNESEYLRLQSEVVSISLGDTGYLRRTGQFHSLILSTDHGLLLGPGCDPEGEPYTDYVFLHAGITAASETPSAPTPVNAFLRVFAQESADLPTPWLLPYIGAPITIPVPTPVSRTPSPFLLNNLTMRQPSSPTMRGHRARKYQSAPSTRAGASPFQQIPVNRATMTAWATPSSTRRSARLAGHSKARAISEASTVEDERAAKRHRAASSDGDYHPPPDRTTQARRASPMDTDTDTEWEQLKHDITEEMAADSRKIAQMQDELEHDVLQRLEDELENERFINDRAQFRFALQYLTGLTSTNDFIESLHDESPRAASPDALTRLLGLPQFNPTPPASPIIVGRALIPESPVVVAVRNAPSDTDLLLSIAQLNPTLPKPMTAKKPLRNSWPPYEQIRSEFEKLETHAVPVFHIRPILDNGSRVSVEHEVVSDSLPELEPIPEPIPERTTADSAPPTFTPMVVQSDDSDSDDSLAASETLSPREEVRLNRKKALQELRHTIDQVETIQEAQISKLELFRSFIFQFTNFLDLMEPARTIRSADFDATSGGRSEMDHSQASLSIPPPPRPKFVYLDTASESSRPASPISINRQHDEDPTDASTQPTHIPARPTIIPQCQTYPPNFIDPRVLPFQLRAYHGAGPNNDPRDLSYVEQRIAIDIRTCVIIDDTSDVPAEHVRNWSLMGGALEGLIFPGTPIQSSRHPLPVAPSTAKHWMGRIRELQLRRQNIEHIYQFSYDFLTPEEQLEARSSTLTFYKRLAPGSQDLSRVKVDRGYAHARMHPVWSPLVKPAEAAFLRTASYFLYKRGELASATRIDELLRTPENDDWEIREMVCRGSLDSIHRIDECVRYFGRVDDEHWDYHANEKAASSDVREWYQSRCGTVQWESSSISSSTSASPTRVLLEEID